eukprot:jgi/Botrbrau1/3371/Bobra.0337s0012.1
MRCTAQLASRCPGPESTSNGSAVTCGLCSAEHGIRPYLEVLVPRHASRSDTRCDNKVSEYRSCKALAKHQMHLISILHGALLLPISDVVVSCKPPFTTKSVKVVRGSGSGCI